MKNFHKFFVGAMFIGGVLLALQVRSYGRVKFEVGRSSPAAVLGELRVFQIANAELRNEVAEKEKLLKELQTKISQEKVEEEIARLKLLSGEYAVYGEGLDLTLSAPIKAYWMSDLIASLISGGAEAVSINDVRLTVRTAGFRSIGEGMLMRRYFFRPPLRITVIGPKAELKRIITQSSGILDRIEDDHKGLKIFVAERDKIIMPAIEE